MTKTEKARLQAVAEYGQACATPEEAFDRITQLASDLFGAPIALVSLIGQDRQWFKSRRGIRLKSTPREWSFCDHAIRMGAGEVMVVEDATLDDRFAGNPLVVGEPGIRFYLGAPLRGRGGHNLGALCVIDLEPRAKPSAAELNRLKALAAIVVDELELSRARRDATEKQRLLEEAQAQAESAAAVKGEFLANMSHELRTPITSILGFSSLASWQADLSDATRGHIDRVVEASRALLGTVNDILDFSALEAGSLAIRREPVGLEALFGASLDLFLPQADAKGLKVHVVHESRDDLMLEVDPGRLRQILLNLVGNAVKFTADGEVRVQTAYDPAAGRLRVEVLDTGPGIAPEMINRLFVRFSQVDGSLSRSHGGSGLGLAICKGLVEAMGGEIGVESTVDVGSRFWFEIPAALASPAEPTVVEAPSRSPVLDLRVLVVDDNAANRALARLVLTHMGARVWEAADGELASAQAADTPFDVILMDLRMPRLDGFGALEHIRAKPGPNRHTPILAFTADTDSRAAERLQARGFQGLIAKPAEPAQLIAEIAGAVQSERRVSAVSAS